MSFSSKTKAELCKLQSLPKCCSIAECYGILLYCNTFTNHAIKIITESRPLAKRLPRLFKRAFGFGFDSAPDDLEKAGKLAFIMEDRHKLDKIFSTYGYERQTSLAHHINLGVLEEDCCRQSFMRGAFFTGGSITDPQKRYHLELVTDHYSVSRETYALLLEMGFQPKSTSRKGNYITYFKQSEAIEDFLTTIGAPVAAMEIMSAKITKEMYNSVNRRVNCDTANVAKTVEASSEHIEAIRKIEQAGGLDNLPDKLRETAVLRIENPELSLTQLAELLVPPVTKSCLYHRLRKLVEIAKEV